MFDASSEQRCLICVVASCFLSIPLGGVWKVHDDTTRCASMGEVRGKKGTTG